VGAFAQHSGVPEEHAGLLDFLISHIDLNERGTITPRPQLMDRELVRVGCLRDAAQAAPAVRLNAGGYLHSLTAYGLWYAFRPPGLLPLVEGSWHFGIELVDPFCNEDFFQFAWKLPSDWKIRDGFNKILLRRVVGDLLPKEIAERSSKVGFDVPFLPWSRTPPFRDFIAEMLAATEAQDLEPIVDVAALRAAVTAEKPRPVSGMLLWQAVNAVMWLRMLRGG
jgi:asparagine synthetase B (glutamine-hydrolysing)